MTSSLRDAWSEPGDSATVGWLRCWLAVGIAWLIVGMAVMPAGVSYNPGKPYQYVLGLTLWLPTIVLTVIRPQRTWEFLRRPLLPWAIALLIWGCLSLLWTHAGRRPDEAAHNISILFFLIAAQWVFSVGEQPTRRLLIFCSVIMAVIAAFDMGNYLLHPPVDPRLVGIGVMANANLAAAGMAAAMLWYWPWRVEGWRWGIVKWLVISVLILFVLLTFTRSAWAAMFAALVVLIVSRGGRRAWIYALLICVLGAIGAAAGMHILLERGWSLRPQIFASSMALIAQHPLRGLGEGNPFVIIAGSETLDHAHNMFAQLAIELGLPALLLCISIWFALGWRAWRHRHETIGQVVLGLWTFGTVAVQFDLPHLIDSPRPGWLITWLPLALSAAYFGRGSAATTRNV
jgi:O-antigen ligase